MHDGMSSSSGKSNRDTGSNYGQFDRAVSRAKNNPTSTTTGGGNGGVDPGFQNALRKQAIAKKNKEIKDAQEAAGFYANQSVKYSKPTFASKYNDVRNYGYQQGINRNKVLAMRKMDLMKKGLPGMYGAFISGITGKVPDWAQNMSVQELEALAGDIQGIKDYNQATYNKDLNPANKTGGLNLLNRVDEAQTLLDSNLMKQVDYDRLFPGPVIDQGGDGPRPYLPIDYNTGAGTTEDIVDDKEFAYHLGLGGQKVGRDVTLGYAANGGRITRAGGGIMNAVPRQRYFLGKIVKGVGKAIGSVADAAGKVLKSDVGKLALAAGAFYYGGGGAGAFKDKTFFGGLGQLGKNFMSTKNPLLFNAAGKLSLGKLGLASMALPYLMPEAKPNEDIGMAD